MRKWLFLAALGVVVYWFFGRADSMPLEQLERWSGRSSAPAEVAYVGGSCAAEQCLMIYLAPWCPQCRQAHRVVLDTVERMREQGIETTVVLGLDERAALQDYAAEFPFPVYFDPERRLFDGLGASGVPHFTLWNRDRTITGEISGRPSSVDHLKQGLEIGR